MTTDTQVEETEEPVTVEEEIASLMAAAEEQEQDDVDAGSEETDETGQEANTGDSDEDSADGEGEESSEIDNGGEDADGESGESGDTENGGDDGEGESPDSQTNLSGDEKLEAPEHWSAADKESFNEQPKGAQEFILKRHKEIEGDYTRKRQQESSKVRIAEAVTDALSPHQQEFAAAGLDEAGAVRQLASWHTALKTSPREAIQQLAATYGVDLSEPDLDDETTDPALRSIQQELGSIKEGLTRNEQLAQQREQQELVATIQTFENAKDGEGKLMHPHFKELHDDITLLFEMGKVKSLEEGYEQALRLRPDLAVQKPVEKAKPKVDPVEKVKQAKRAATGVKSSGAVGKRDRGKMSLEEEIASHF